MQILRLKLCNLASLKDEQIIDFQQQPLQSAGLIAITGQTGAGKSTLLDAICLALYDKIPRFRGASNNSTIDDFNQADDSKQILKRGEMHGYAEVEFIGVDQKRYLAGTKISRVTRGKTKGKLNANKRYLQCIDDDYQLLADKPTLCNRLIVEKIGLDYEQFTRSVLLAQSEVGAFLKAKDDERAKLLEHLTNSGIFKKIGQKAAEQFKLVNEEYEKVKTTLDMIELLDDDELLSKQTQQQHLNQQLKQLQAELQNYTQQQQIHQKYIQLSQELAEYQQQLHHLQQQNIQQKQQDLQKIQQYQIIAPDWQQFQNGTKDLQKIQVELQEKQIQATQSQEKLHHIQHEFDIAQQKKEAKLPILEQQLSNAKQSIMLNEKIQQLLQDYQHKNHELKQQAYACQQNKQLIDDKNQQLIKYQQQQLTLVNQQQALNTLNLEPMILIPLLEEYQQYLTQIEQKIPQFYAKSGALADWLKHYQQLQQSYQQLQQQHGDLNALQEQKATMIQNMAELDKQYTAIQFAQQALADYQYQQNHAHQLNQQLTELTTQYQQAKQAEQIAQQHYAQCEQHWQMADELLQKQRILSSQNIVDLRKQLQENQPCMVCGSVNHPYREYLHENLLQAHQEQELKLRKAKQEAFEQWDNAKLDLVQMTTLLQNCQAELDKMQLSKYADTLDLAVKNLSIMEQLMQCEKGQLWDDILSDYLYKIQNNQENLKQQLAKLMQDIEHYTNISHDLQKQQAIEQDYQRLHDVECKIIAKLSVEGQTQWQKDNAQISQRWLSDLTKYQKLVEQLSEIAEIIKQLHHDLMILEKDGHYADEKYQVLQQNIEQITQQGKELREQMHGYFQGSDIQEQERKQPQLWENRLLAEKNQQLTQCQQLEKQLQDTQYQYQMYMNEINQLQQRQQYLVSVNHQLREKINHFQQQYVDFDDEQLLFLWQQNDLNEQLSQLKLQVEYYQRDVTQCNTKIEVIDKNIQALEISNLMPLAEIEQKIDDLSIIIHQQQAQLNQITAILLLHEQKQAKYQHYEQEVQQKKQNYMRWQRIHELIGKREGAYFQKIAQEYYLDILLQYANFQLSQLTKRYELRRIANSLSLYIIDHDMNDEQRSVLSLSGGESFLVSLSLALGIAHMAANHIQLETLFIDEGFGTLDSETLNIVMDTLDRLQSQGRKVVIISHISEIHERIPVKIRVRSKGAGESYLMLEN